MRRPAPPKHRREHRRAFARLPAMTTASIVPPPAPQYLSEVLELEQLDTNLFRSKVNQVNNNRSLFGGQILGQGLKAAALTVEPGRRPQLPPCTAVQVAHRFLSKETVPWGCYFLPYKLTARPGTRPHSPL